MTGRRRHQSDRGFGIGSVALAATLAAFWGWACAPASWGMVVPGSDGAAAAARQLSLGAQPGPAGQEAGEGGAAGALSGRLRLGLRGELEIGLFGKRAESLGLARDEVAGGLQGMTLTDPVRAAVPRGGSGARLGELREEEAVSYRLSYGQGALALEGSLLDVGSRFALGGDARGTTPAEMVKLLEEAAGTRAVDLGMTLQLAPGASLNSQHKSVANDRPGDEKRGLTTRDTSHTVQWELGAGSRLTASLAEHSEDWAAELGRTGVSRRTEGIELKSAFGGRREHEVRLALTSMETEQGEAEQSERVREAHLSLAPAARLRVFADYVGKGMAGGGEETTQNVAAVLQLAPEAELSAAVKRLSPEGGERTRESSVGLSTRIGGGGSAGRLKGEEVVVRGEGGKLRRQRKWELSGALGSGERSTRLQASLEEKREEGESGGLEGGGMVRVERPLGSGLKLTAERRHQLGGTGGAPEVTVQSRCELAAELGPKTTVGLGLVLDDGPRGADGRGREIRFGHEWGGMALRVERQVRGGREASSVASYSLEARTGELPDWARQSYQEHAFAEAPEYLGWAPPSWMEMPFAGYRVWGKLRAGAAEDGVDTIALAHRRIIGGKWHLQLTFEERPEGTEGEDKGRAMPVRRQRLDLATPIGAGLVVRGSCETEASRPGSAAEGSERGVALGVWGRLSEQEQVEASVSRDAGRWEDGEVEHTSISLLYARQVDEGHRVHVKVGYGWGEQRGGEPQRESRISLGYEKPI